MPINTQGIVLKYGATAEALAKLCAIKDVPEMVGAPEMIETTTLDDEQQTYIFGVAANGLKEFTANYGKTEYAALVANSRTPGFYSIEIGDNGVDGKFTWQGEHVVGFPGAGTNGVLEMKIYVAPSTKITFA